MEKRNCIKWFFVFVVSFFGPTLIFIKLYLHVIYSLGEYDILIVWDPGVFEKQGRKIPNSAIALVLIDCEEKQATQ